MMNSIGLYLISLGENNFVGIMGKTPRLMKLTLEYHKARVLVLSYFLSRFNDLPKVIENCNVAIYVDDSGLYLRGASLAQLNETIK